MVSQYNIIYLLHKNNSRLLFPASKNNSRQLFPASKKTQENFSPFKKKLKKTITRFKKKLKKNFPPSKNYSRWFFPLEKKSVGMVRSAKFFFAPFLFSHESCVSALHLQESFLWFLHMHMWKMFISRVGPNFFIVSREIRS